MARFFIDRPVFAWVLAIIMMIAGAISITRLPVERYPTIAPPTVTVSAFYPGATARSVEESVTQIIEQNMRGLDGLLYMSANSESSGRASVTLTFESGTDPDIAQVQVQNKLELALPLLPQTVREQGVSVTKATSNFLMVVAFVSDNPRFTKADVDDYVAANLVDPVARVPGVGDVQFFGTQYAMRIWLDPQRLDAYRLTPVDVISAIRAQNQQVAIGELGGTPAIPGQQLNAPITAQGRLQTPEQFRGIVLRGNPDGSTLTLGDVARVELGAESYSFIGRFNAQPASGMAISLATGANAIATSKALDAKLAEMSKSFPAGLRTVVPFDTTPFVEAAIKGVIATLLEAVALVFVVMFLFLQNLRATLIPTIAVPVVLLGTFAVLAALGYSVNMLTMFAMVLAIGLLVDDAIVVVENVERIMHEEGLSPLEATRKSMGQITGALVGVGLVLAAVFVPMAFLGGSTGVIYRQFSATIVSAMALSVAVAIVLTPALCATMLKPVEKETRPGAFFTRFNRGFDRGSARYQGIVRGMLGRRRRWLATFAVVTALAGFLFLRLPTAFLPNEDQGWMMAQVLTPTGATQERTMESIRAVERHFMESEKDTVKSVFTVQGFSFAGSGQNAGIAWINLKDWSERTTPDRSVDAVAGRAYMALGQIKDAFAFAFAPPPLPELGRSRGFTFNLKDEGGVGHEALVAARNQFLGMASQSKLLANVRPNGQEDAPQFRVDVDPRKAAALGVPINDIAATLATAWGGQYIDDFVDRGRVKRVYVQSDAPFRMVPEDFNRWTVRNDKGEMVPVPSFATWHWVYGPPQLQRFNGAASLEVDGEPAPGVSSGTAMAEVERLVGQLPPGVGMEWTGQSYQERSAGAQTPMLYTLSLLVVFLCLAAMYESWAIPTAVLLVVPLGILGTVLAATLRGMERDVYFQVAMLTTVGLSSKNAILIITFAKDNFEAGMDLIEATMTAVRIRIRPILMTSLAFGLGVLPLALATGAGSGAQRAIGTGVLGGMLAGTLLGVFFTPLFFVVIEKLMGRRTAAAAAQEPSA
ncbi:MAG: efflux RND transporter permease subunit [Steroidobacteraceae bacterium]